MGGVIAVVMFVAAWLLAKGANLQSAIVLTCGAASFVLVYAYWGDGLAPPVLWVSIWALSLALGRIEVWLRSTYTADWSAQLWGAFVGAALAFTCGSYIAGKPTGDIRPAPRWSRLRLDFVILTCFAIGSATYIYTTIRAGGIQNIPLFSLRPAQARQEFGVQGTSYFLLLLAAVVPLVTVSVLFLGGWRKNKQNIFLASTAVFLLLSTANRAIAMEVLCISFFAIAIVRGIRWRAVLIGLVVFALIFVAIGYARQINNAHDQALFSGGSIGIANPILAMAYIYFGTAFTNLQYIFDNIHTLGYGGVMLRAPLHAFGMEDFIKIPVINWDAWNTTTGLASYYYDFGIAGVILFPFVLGIISGKVYRWCRMEPSPFHAILYGIVATSVLASVETERFFEGTSLLYIAVTLATRVYCERRQTAVRIPAGAPIHTAS